MAASSVFALSCFLPSFCSLDLLLPVKQTWLFQALLALPHIICFYWLKRHAALDSEQNCIFV